MSPADKLGWYYRYWPSMQITRGETSTFVFTDWDTKIANDPLFNKKMKDEKKKQAECVNDNVLGSGAIEMDLGGFLDIKEDGCDECQPDAK